MSKFARIFEDKKGEQLLIRLSQNEEDQDKCDIVHELDVEGAHISFSIGGVEWDKGESYINEYEQEKAEKILEDPMEFITNLTS